jgi:iron(III) transport system permease protein
LVAVTGVILGFIFAFAVTRTSLPKPLKWLLGAVTILPLVSPPFTSSIALTFALGPNGILLKALGIPNIQLYGVLGTWISETLTYFPIAFLTISAVLAAIDPNLEDAALSLGSSKLRTFRTITLPLSTPGLANSFLLLFASSLSDFATPLILAGHSFPVLPTQAYLQITGLHDLKSGAGLSFILLIPALAVYLLQRYWIGNKSYVTVTGKAGARTQLKGIGKLPEIGIWTVCFAISIFILFLYSIIFYSSFIKVWGINLDLTLDNYKYVFTMGQKAIIDTLLIAAVATPLGGLVALAVGYLSSRRHFAGQRIMEFVSLLN